MKGEGLLERVRREYQKTGKPLTKYRMRELYPASGKFVKEVVERAVELGLLKPVEKCVRAYVPDPDSSRRVVCSFEPSLQYEESICAVMEKMIENNPKVSDEDLEFCVELGRKIREWVWRKGMKVRFAD
ncbi:MAG: hypothetical protein QXL22_04390 [Candidatus Nezhaarchaeales archaeon]